MITNAVFFAPKAGQSVWTVCLENRWFYKDFSALPDICQHKLVSAFSLSGSSVHSGRAGSTPASRTTKKATHRVVFFVVSGARQTIPFREFNSRLAYSERNLFCLPGQERFLWCFINQDMEPYLLDTAPSSFASYCCLLSNSCSALSVIFVSILPKKSGCL